jgi:hypothetical protein
MSAFFPVYPLPRFLIVANSLNSAKPARQCRDESDVSLFSIGVNDLCKTEALDKQHLKIE